MLTHMNIKSVPENFQGGIIGISSDMLPDWTFDSLKQDFLLFDVVGMLGLHSIVELWEDFPDEFHYELSSVQYLLDQDVIFDADHGIRIDPKTDNIVHTFEEVRQIRQDFMSLNVREDDYVRKEDHFNRVAYDLRVSAVHHQLADGLPTIPAVSPSIFPTKSKYRGNAAHVVINAFPIIDYSQLPFEEIFSLREEKELIEYRTRLRRWMRQLDSQNLNMFEIQDEIEFLLTSYEKYMKLMKLKHHIGSFHSLINICASSVENLVKLNLTKLSDDLFNITHRNVALIEAELSAPGRELAYMHMMKEKLD